MNTLKKESIILHNLFKLNDEKGCRQKMLVAAPQGCGKSSVLADFAVNSEYLYNYNRVAVLMVDERQNDALKYQSNNVEIWGIYSNDTRSTKRRYVEVRNFIDIICNGDYDLVIIDSITGLYDLLCEYLNLVKSNQNAALSGGFNAKAGQMIKKFINKFHNNGKTTVISGMVVDNDRKDYKLLFTALAKDSDGELHLNETLADLNIFPAINLLKSQIRNIDSYFKGEHLILYKDLKNKLSNCNHGDIIQKIFDLNYVPHVNFSKN